MAQPFWHQHYYQKPPKGGVSTGTSIIAVEFNGGVVIGADSRTSAGSYVANRVSDKLTQVHDRVYCCRSGSAADTQAVTDYVRDWSYQHAMSEGRAPNVGVVAQFFKHICYGNKDALSASIICAGWDPVRGGQVYSLPLGGAKVRQSYAIGGSGSTYIYGYCDSVFREGMNKAECLDFVHKALAHAMARDGSSGGVIRTVVITKDGCERGFVGGDQLPYNANELDM